MPSSYNPPSGGSFNPHSPGPIGDVTPDTITATSFNSNGFISTSVGSGSVANGQISWGSTGDLALLQANLPATGSWEIGCDVQLDANIIALALPTSDPHVVGQFYLVAGVVNVSNG